MYTILIIIGLGTICWFLSKAFNSIGNALEKIGDALADWSASSAKMTKGFGADGSERKIREKIKALRGEGTDEEYTKQIREEIDDITKE